MINELTPLPYPYDGLEPAMSRETLGFHHDRHHRGYVNRLDALVDEAGIEAHSLEQLVREARGEMFDNAAQIWNHDFFWACLRPESGKPAPDGLLDAIAVRWDSLQDFQHEFETAAMGHFGSGWTWLVMDRRGRLRIATSTNADTPVRHGLTPLLTCDLWEHAYYIDYRNRRDEYLSAYWTIVNWDFAEAQRQAALRRYEPEEGLHRIRLGVA